MVPVGPTSHTLDQLCLEAGAVVPVGPTPHTLDQPCLQAGAVVQVEVFGITPNRGGGGGLHCTYEP